MVPKSARNAFQRKKVLHALAVGIHANGIATTVPAGRALQSFGPVRDAKLCIAESVLGSIIVSNVVIRTCASSVCPAWVPTNYFRRWRKRQAADSICAGSVPNAMAISAKNAQRKALASSAKVVTSYSVVIVVRAIVAQSAVLSSAGIAQRRSLVRFARMGALDRRWNLWRTRRWMSMSTCNYALFDK